MRAWHLVVLIAAVAIYVIMRPPSAAKIVRGMEVSIPAGTIEYADVRYAATWSDSIVRSGDIRYLSRAYTKSVPMVIYDAVLTSGEFSDSSIVEIESTGGGNFYWRSKKQPQGTLVALHIIPENEIVLRSLASVDEGDRIEIVGRDEINGKIEGADGSFLRLAHDNHKFVLASRVSVEN
ncbi:MAG: hypothetical protein OEM62_00055 [Acidobacteriota bacterium]|nr:hypothetical protein [Acidobacteriota bacterium]